MNLRQFERRIIVGSRFFTVIAVFGSLVGSLIMFLLGLVNIAQAVWPGLHIQTGEDAEAFGLGAVIHVITALDRFLIAIVLLYFAYGVYSLFIHPEEPEEKLAIPAWLQVKQIGQLKQVVAEVIIVVLFVLFLRVALQAFRDPSLDLSWLELGALALLPLATVLLALALRFVELHPKPTRPLVGGRPSESDRKPLTSQPKSGSPRQ